MATGGDNKSNSSLRFADIGALPKRMLAPIEGYEDTELVSLEEAVKPLVNIVPKVERNVFIVKQNCQNPEDGLTTDESASIMLYTYESMPHKNSLYVILNETLRSEQRQKLIPWFAYLRLVLTALAQLPSERHFVNRGVREDLRAAYPIGSTFIWWSFSSCTSTVAVLESEQFFGKTGTRTLFQIDCETGKDIKNHSFIQQEDEVLLLPARQFVVKSCLDSGNGLHIIQLKETEPSYPLLEPVPIPKQIGQAAKSTSHVKLEATGQPSKPIQPVAPKISTPSKAQAQVKPSVPLRASGVDLHPNARWNQHGQTVGGQNPTLDRPWGVFVADDQTVYVADWGNHRIVAWKEGETQGQVVAGGNGQGKGDHQLNYPTDMIVDKENDSLLICDRENNRVVRWPRRNGTRGETVVSNIRCRGLTLDEEGSLYVSDTDEHEVRRYRRGDSQGTLVAGGNGGGDRLNQLNYPTYLFVDREHSVFVSDNHNHRVMKWTAGAKEGMVVAGGRGEGGSLSQLNHPQGVLVDQLGTVYVADFWNHRVVRWPKGAEQGMVVVGGNGAGVQAHQLNCPEGLSFDRHGHLYVVDYGNSRVQKFTLEMSSK